MPAIYLMGFMGSGKSAVARQLARSLELPLIDLDQLIEQEIGSSIADYFATHGENAFRDVETRLLLDTASQNAVVSLGGGVPTVAKNREFLKNMARNGAMVVYLKATTEVLASRIRRQPGKRPLIDGDGNLDYAATCARVAHLLEQRAPLYEEAASVVVQTGELDVETVAREVVEHWTSLKAGDGSP